VLVAGEPSAPATRHIIEETWGARTVDFYGNTENLSYLGVDCPQKNGFHFWQDRVVVEIINPETGERVPEGEEGELVFTNLTVESMPAIRLRIGDLTAISRDSCPCGCTHNRVLYVLGRREHVIKMRGLNVYPRVVEDIVRSTPHIGSEYRVIFERERGLDHLRLQVEPLPGVDEAGRQHIMHGIQERLKMSIGISALIDLLPHGTLPKSEQKAKRIVDHRSTAGGPI
jgi:phenylacetate-CoA ligase